MAIDLECTKPDCGGIETCDEFLSDYPRNDDARFDQEFLPGSSGRDYRNVATRALLVGALAIGESTLGLGTDLAMECDSTECSYVSEPEAFIPGSSILVSEFHDCFSLNADIPSNIEQHLSSLVQDAVLPAAWKSEGVDSPSKECYTTAHEFLKSMYRKYGMLPSKVVATKSTTIYIRYYNAATLKALRVEIDDDLDVIASLSDGSKFPEAGAFEGAFADKLVEKLRGEHQAKPASKRTWTQEAYSR